MKKYYLVAMAMIIVLVISLIGYGIFINYEGERVISDRMSKQAVTVQTAKASYRELHPSFDVENAQMQSSNATDVIAKVDGVITSNTLHKNQQVKKGETVAVLTNEEIPLRIIQAESALKRAEAAELQYRNSFDRYSRLVKLNAVAMEKYDEAQANYVAAQAQVVDAKASLDQALLSQSRLHVVSNLDGVVMVIYKDEGSFVTAGTPICLVGDFSRLWFSLNMEDPEVRSLLGDAKEKAILELSFRRWDMGKAFDTEYGAGNKGNRSTFDTEIQGIYPSLDKPADIRRVVFYVNNPTSVLEAKSYDNLLLTNKAQRRVMCVPYGALFDDSNDDSTVYNLYVVNEENKLEQRTVKVGSIGDNYAEILDGVKEGETVVISGWETLEDGQRVEVETGAE